MQRSSAVALLACIVANADAFCNDLVHLELRLGDVTNNNFASRERLRSLEPSMPTDCTLLLEDPSGDTPLG